jgi:hypothetical protein
MQEVLLLLLCHFSVEQNLILYSNWYILWSLDIKWEEQIKDLLSFYLHGEKFDPCQQIEVISSSKCKVHNHE